MLAKNLLFSKLFHCPITIIHINTCPHCHLSKILEPFALLPTQSWGQPPHSNSQHMLQGILVMSSGHVSSIQLFCWCCSDTQSGRNEQLYTGTAAHPHQPCFLKHHVFLPETHSIIPCRNHWQPGSRWAYQCCIHETHIHLAVGTEWPMHSHWHSHHAAWKR